MQVVLNPYGVGSNTCHRLFINSNSSHCGNRACYLSQSSTITCVDRLLLFLAHCNNTLTSDNDNRQQHYISTAFFNIVRGAQNIYDSDSIENVSWQTVGKLTSSNSGVSDYILQICLPKPNFPCKAALS